MANRVRPITVTEADRRELERLQRASSIRAGVSRRARAVLLMVHGLSGVEIATRTGYTVVQVSRLRRRFAEGGVAGLQERPRSGRPPTLTARQRARIVALTFGRRSPGRPTGPRGTWPGAPASRTRPCIGSGGPTRSSPIG